MITGEPMPVKSVRATVIGGTSTHRHLDAGRARRQPKPARADRADGRGAQRIARTDTAARGSVAGGSCLASSAWPLLTFIVWGLFGPEPRMAYGSSTRVAVLIIACPCALGLATPMSIMVGDRARAATRRLFRDAAAIEALRTGRYAGRRQDRHADRRKARVRTSRAADGFDDDEVLRLAATLDRAASIHSRDAIVRGARDARTRLSSASTSSIRRPAWASSARRGPAGRARQPA